MSKLKYLSGATQVLKWSVLYPIDNENSRLRKILYFIWAFFFVASFAITDIQCIMFLLKNPFDLLVEAMVVMNSAIYISLFINFFIFFYNSKKLVTLVNNININFVEETDNEIEQVAMKKSSNLADKLAYFWTSCVISSGIFVGILPLISGDRNIMPIPGWFPYDHTKSPQYELSYIWQIFCQINLGLIYGASDMIYPCMTIVIGQQFKILASNLRNNFYKAVLKSKVSKKIVTEFREASESQNLFSLMNEYNEIFVFVQDAKFQKNNVNYLKKNIEHHQVLLKYCDDLNTIMSPFLMTKVMAVSLVTIFTVFTLITSADRTMIFGLCSYVFFGSAELFIYNYSGQVLIESGDALWTLYKCPWYLCDLKFQKLLLMVQMRISEMTFTKAGNYFTMSAETFIGFIKCVFSYAAVLKEVTKSGKY